jgi:hypothetical protein
MTENTPPQPAFERGHEHLDRLLSGTPGREPRPAISPGRPGS